MKPLYMAKSVKDLQKRGELPSNTSLNRLLKSGKKVVETANISFKEKDEEKAYVMYMKVLFIVQQSQQSGSKAEQSQRINNHIGSTNVKTALERVEKLQASLEERYNNEYPIKKKEEVLPKEEVKKKPNSSIRSPDEATETDGTIQCKKLYSLITQKSTSFLVIDIRPKADFKETSIDIPNVINIPREVLKPVLTAEAAGLHLDENSLLIWRKRTSYDILIICDLKSDKPPFPQPVNVMLDAILKWDPGKHYKSKPFILAGGFDLFLLMYPMLIRNPLCNQANNHTPVTPNNILNFEYPDLDTGFLEAPSPPQPTGVQKLEAVPVPIINRNLKPASGPEPTSNGVSTLVEKFDSLGTNVKPQKPTVKQIEIEVQPEVPNRTLKPIELLERLKANMANFDKERETLEMTILDEQTTLEKLQEIEETKKKRDATDDNLQKIFLTETEQKLREDVAQLKSHSEKLESDFNTVSKQNQQLWKVIREFLNSPESSKSDNSLKTSTAAPKEETELIARNRKIEDLNTEVEFLRKKRKEKEVRIAQQKETIKEDKLIDEQKSNNEIAPSSHHSRPTERQPRPKTHTNANGTDKNAGSRRRGDTFTANLKSSPRSSPVRGGTNLRRSHSAFNIAQLKDDDSFESAVMPSFDRRLKPMDSPQKRNVNAARHRNFEPKCGNVGRGKTGLKNLGNTCYMNSVIQCLNNTIPLAQFFMNNSYSDKINENSRQRGMVAEEMAAVIRALWCGYFKSISMWDLKNVVAKHHKPFFGFDQQDSHEFLLKLMDWLNDDLNMIKVKPARMTEQNFEDMPDYLAAEKVTAEMNKQDNSIVRTLFHGLHQSVITCSTCDHRSITFEPFSVLTVSLPTNGPCSLEDQIREYYRITEIEYKCASCKKQRICTRKMNIWQLPPVLVIHLNRFEHDVLMKKNPNFVDFPTENLDLAPYVVSTNNKYECYDLYACSNHYGTMDGGHYTAFCLSKSFGWLKFDDNEVYELALKSVKTSAAYILFYQAANLNSSVI